MTWVSYLTIMIMTALLALIFAATVRKSSKKEEIVLGCFNLAENMKHFKIRSNENLNVWDGVRGVAMMWVIIGHCYFFSLFAGPVNISDFIYHASKPFFLLITGGLVSVDIFLALGGFFLAFVMLRQTITIKNAFWESHKEL